MFERIEYPAGHVLTHPDMWVPNNPAKPKRGRHIMEGGEIRIDEGSVIGLRLIREPQNSYDYSKRRN